jgi:hypothetical protein
MRRSELSELELLSFPLSLPAAAFAPPRFNARAFDRLLLQSKLDSRDDLSLAYSGLPVARATAAGSTVPIYRFDSPLNVSPDPFGFELPSSLAISDDAGRLDVQNPLSSVSSSGPEPLLNLRSP